SPRVKRLVDDIKDLRKCVGFPLLPDKCECSLRRGACRNRKVKLFDQPHEHVPPGLLVYLIKLDARLVGDRALVEHGKGLSCKSIRRRAKDRYADEYERNAPTQVDS